MLYRNSSIPKPFLCKLGFHKFSSLSIEPGRFSHGLQVYKGKNDEFDESQYLHAEQCNKCATIRTFITHIYWTSNLDQARFHREPSIIELKTFLDTLKKL